MRVHTVQLHIGDMLGGTSSMDATELGAYMSLMLACYQASDHHLPADSEERLARMARVTPKVWSRVRGVVMVKFKKDDAGWWHERVMKEVEKMTSLSAKNKGNRLKKKKSPRPVVPPKRDEAPRVQTEFWSDQTATNHKPVTTNQKPKPTLEEVSIEHIEKWLREKRAAGLYQDVDENLVLENFKDYCLAKGAKYVDYVAAFRNAFKWENSHPAKRKPLGRDKESPHDVAGRAWAHVGGITIDHQGD